MINSPIKKSSVFSDLPAFLRFSSPILSLSLMTNSSRTQARGRTRIVVIQTEARKERERKREREIVVTACNQPHTKPRARIYRLSVNAAALWRAANGSKGGGQPAFISKASLSTRRSGLITLNVQLMND